MQYHLVWLAAAAAAAWFFPVFAEAAAGQGVCLVGPQSGAVVVVPGNPPARGETLNAALEVSHYVEKMTGRPLPVISEGQGTYQRVGNNWRVVPFSSANPFPKGEPEIHVGWTTRTLREVDRTAIERLDPDGFLIRVRPDAIFLVGPTDWSTAYACYTFLEDLCGVRWYLPGEMGEDVPTQDTLVIPTIDKTYEPAFQHRQYSGNQWRNANEMRRWEMHRKVRPRLEYHHNLYRVFDVTKYGEPYPDLYPILGGRRRIPGPGNPSGWQPCLTHPKAVDLAIDYAKEYFAKNPDAASISLGINDGGGYCECPRCMALVDATLPSEGQRSVWFFQFANAVAERFDQLFPNKQIGYLLYGQCKLFPPGMRIHPRLVGFYVWPSFRLITKEGRKDYDRRLKEIAKTVSCFGLYDWFYGDGLCVPRLQIRQAKYWLEQGYKMGARHVKAEAYMNWGLDGFKYWMHTRLMWDPSLSVEAMEAEFFSRFFKEAARPMQEYFRIVEQYTVKPVVPKGARGPVNFSFRYPEQLESFPPRAVARCEPLLEEATRRAQSPIVRERVAYFRAAFEVAKRLTLQYHFAKQAEILLAKPNTLPRGMDFLAKALSPNLDVETYYQTALREDPFCVRYPPEMMFGSVTRARGIATRTLSQMVIAELQKPGALPTTPERLEEITGRVLARVWSAIRDPETRAVAQEAIGPFAGKVLLCQQAPAPTIDGKLDDPCWRTAPVARGFIGLGTGKPTQFPTEVRATYDGERLYVAYRCVQDTSVLLAWTRERDGRVWREDSVEILLNKPTDTKEEERCQVIINTRGNLFDYYNGSAAWDGDIQVGTSVEPNAYVVEVSLPWKAIGIDPGRDRFLRFNCVRNVYGRATLGSDEAKEVSTWYPTPGSTLPPTARGWLVLN